MDSEKGGGSIPDHISGRLKKLTDIGIALSAEQNIDILFEMIVDEARALSNADAGTLYIVDREEEALCFKILQNASLDIRMGGRGGNSITLPDVPLYINGVPNYSNVSSFAALVDRMISIPDVYDSLKFDFTGPMRYDRSMGYRSKSMLVIPMKNHDNEVIGVLQLLNAKDAETQKVIPFPEVYVGLVASLASQAAVALTNTQLIKGMKDFFDSFMKSIAGAVDEKSPYTGGHIKRVVELTMMIAQAVNKAVRGPLKECFLDEDMLEELRISAWMHDIGKIATPEHLVDKCTKLHSIYDRIELIEARFNMIATTIENDYLKQKIRIMEEGGGCSDELRRLSGRKKEKLERLFEELDFIKRCNLGSENMAVEKVRRIREISEQRYTAGSRLLPYLEECEVTNLSIMRGTLNDEERKAIEGHAEMTLKMLSLLPFPGKLSKVPEYAAGHHEKIDGSGYPGRLKGDQIALQTRIIAVADIFEALSAKDRPYREPMEITRVLKIMEKMKEEGKIDPHILDLFIESGVYRRYL